MFDLAKDVRYEGIVTGLSWGNPHVYFELEVTGPDGRPVSQSIEAGPASNLIALGFDTNSLRAGERVIVQAKPNRGGEGRTALGWLLTKADGTAIPLHVRAAAEATPVAEDDAEAPKAPSLAGTWVPQATGFSRLSFAAREWPFTDAGRAAVEQTREARFVARSECVPFGPPALMALPSTTVIEVGERAVTFTLDITGARRIVHLDQASHAADLVPTLHGDSIGHWEGETLVVDTIGYAAHPEGYAFDLPSSAAKHVVERFTLSADRRHLDYEAVVEDPEYLVGPVTHLSQWDYRPEQKPSNLPCDPEVARRFADEQR